MLKYELVKVNPDLFDPDSDEANVYYTLKFPEVGVEYAVVAVPGYNMFRFKRKGGVPVIHKEFEGSFTEHRNIILAIENFARNPKNTPSIPKAAKPAGVTFTKAS